MGARVDPPITDTEAPIKSESHWQAAMKGVQPHDHNTKHVGGAVQDHAKLEIGDEESKVAEHVPEVEVAFKANTHCPLDSVEDDNMVQERQSQTCRSKPRDAVKLRVSWADVAATESFSPKLKAAVAKLSSSSHCDLQSKDMLSQSYHQVEPQTECSTSEVVRQSLVDLLGMSCDQRQRLLKGPHISIRIGSVAVPDIPKRVANGIAATGVFFANRKQERRHASQH